MKKVTALLLVLVLALSAVPAYAAWGEKGASEKAYEKASDEAVFHRIGDWFATRGKTPEEAKAIKADRRAQRELKRAQKEAAKAQKQMEKQMKAAQKKGFGKK
jgi:hypothetical protein